MILHVRNPVFIVLLILSLSACSKSDDQRRFEDEAFVEPRGITRTDASGAIQAGEEDPGDWRISPMYQGLIVIDQLPFPNPVDYNSNLTLRINLQVPDAVNYIGIRYFEFPTDPQRLIDELHGLSLQTFNSITLPVNAFASNGGVGSTNIYRILIYDGNDNLITYGDVQIN